MPDKKQEFDAEAFINSWDAPPTDTITLYRHDRSDAIAEAESAVAQALADDDHEAAVEHAKDAARLRDEAADGAVIFTLTALDPDTWRGYTKRMAAGENVMYEQLGRQVTAINGDPKKRMSSLQWLEFGKRAGSARLDTIYGACLVQMNGAAVVLPELSRTTSALLTGESS